MAFTSWSAMISDLKDALADYISGAPMTAEYRIGGRTMVFRSAEEIEGLLDLCRRQESLDSAGDPSKMVSYGRHRRYA